MRSHNSLLIFTHARALCGKKDHIHCMLMLQVMYVLVRLISKGLNISDFTSVLNEDTFSL